MKSILWQILPVAPTAILFQELRKRLPWRKRPVAATKRQIERPPVFVGRFVNALRMVTNRPIVGAFVMCVRPFQNFVNKEGRLFLPGHMCAIVRPSTSVRAPRLGGFIRVSEARLNPCAGDLPGPDSPGCGSSAIRLQQRLKLRDLVYRVEVGADGGVEGGDAGDGTAERAPHQALGAGDVQERETQQGCQRQSQ